MMKILITGLTGYLGRHIGEECYKRGYRVCGLVRNETIREADFNFPVEIFYGSLQLVKSSLQVLNEVDVVIYCAANTYMGAYSNKDQDRINAGALKELLAFSQCQRISKFILISTANTIRAGDAITPGIELNNLELGHKQLNYINSKIKAERILKKAVHDHGLNALILNPTFLIGPVHKKSSSAILFFHIMKSRVLFYPRGGKNVVDVRDVTSACVNAIQFGRSGENYLLSNVNMTFKEIYRRTCEISGCSPIFFPIPSFILTLAGRLGSLLEGIMGMPFVLNHKTVKILKENPYYSSKKAREELGFEPRSVDQSLNDMIKSIRFVN